VVVSTNAPEYTRRWKAAHPDARLASDRRRDRAKIAARGKVANAIRAGRLTRPTVCPACGDAPAPDRLGRSRMEGHHDDHRQALAVRWLCRQCHLAVDREAV